jgi:hypothetical protein
MKKLLKVTALVTGLLTASIANAALITVIHNATVADETAFLSTLTTFQTETFDGMSAANCVPSCTGTGDALFAAKGFITSVGTFKQVKADGTGSEPNNQLNQLQIETSSTGESGRELPFSGNWLDSNDSDVIKWNIDGLVGSNAFGFFLSDANDQGAVLKLVFKNGVTVSQSLNAGLRNGNLAYVTYVGDFAITDATLRFNNYGPRKVSTNDGFGIDNVTVGIVSAPQTILLLSLTILGLVASRKR